MPKEEANALAVALDEALRCTETEFAARIDVDDLISPMRRQVEFLSRCSLKLIASGSSIVPSVQLGNSTQTDRGRQPAESAPTSKPRNLANVSPRWCAPGQVGDTRAWSSRSHDSYLHSTLLHRVAERWTGTFRSATVSQRNYTRFSVLKPPPKSFVMSSSSFEVFVPGRLCILGEHTDWMADYEIGCPGHALVCATNEGLSSRVSLSSVSTLGRSILRFIHKKEAGVVDNSEEKEGEWVFEHALQDVEALRETARHGGFFSYIAGTCAAVMDRITRDKYDKEGIVEDGRLLINIEIDNYRTTLPMKKGLSSSAAICVLVARALTQAVGLELSCDEIMRLAYEGERATPSQCGRMDQCVAMGRGAVALMTFQDSTSFNLRVLCCQKPLFFVVVDLKGSKGTVRILKDLNSCFPVPKNETQALLHRYPMEIQNIVAEAVFGIENGDVLALAQSMKNAQKAFDEFAMPNSPSELTAPLLHALMNDEFIARHALAVKGVGSQGDGSAQILVLDERVQQEMLDYVTNKLELDGFSLTILPSET